MKIINNDFYTNNWQDFVHQWVMKKVENLVQRYDLPVDADTIESFRIQTNEVGTHDFVFNYTKDSVEHTLTITPKNDDVEISISENSTWVVNGEDTGKNTAGLMGPIGERGIQGEQGPKGDKGDQGNDGFTPIITFNNEKTEMTVSGKTATNKVDFKKITEDVVAQTINNSLVTVNVLTQEEYDALGSYENAFYFIKG